MKNIQDNILLFILFVVLIIGGLFAVDYFGENRNIMQATNKMADENNKAIKINDSLNHLQLKNDTIIMNLLKEEIELLKKK